LADAKLVLNGISSRRDARFSKLPAPAPGGLIVDSNRF
jgi:hypothetical protein